jgi:hypothetical protein
LDARLMTVPCKNLLLKNPKQWKLGGLIQDKSGRIFQLRLGHKKDCFGKDIYDDDDNDEHITCI